MRPMIGVPTLLVYRECYCGEWCATGEGALAPVCSACGGRMLPAGSGGNEPGSVAAHEYRRVNGLGFRAALANEIALAEGRPVEEAVRIAAANSFRAQLRYYDATSIGHRSDEIDDAAAAPDGPPDMGGSGA